MPADNEVEAMKNNITELDRYLGPYPFEIWDKWKALSKHITGRMYVETAVAEFNVEIPYEIYKT